MIERATGTRRPDRFVRARLRGTGMVTPLVPVTVEGERLTPGRHRLTPEHPAVRHAPHNFAPCDPMDQATAREMRRLERSQGRPASIRPERFSAANNYGLGPRRREAGPPEWSL